METNPVDLLMWVGTQYTVSEFIREAKRMGVSKRISKTSIPEGIVSGKSKLLIKHRHAIVNSPRLDELADQAGLRLRMPDDMLKLTIALEDLRDFNHQEYFQEWQILVKDFEITWSPGVIGYTTITGVQYVAKPTEQGLPEDLAHMDDLIEPVRIIPEGTDLSQLADLDPDRFEVVVEE